nr:probable inactive purple acid phosphatase 2 [Ipomoea batatas]
MIGVRNPVVLCCALNLFAFLSVCSSDVSISVSPKTLLRSRDPVAIWWSGVSSPSKLDWVGIYSPANSSHDDFIGYVFLSSSPGWENGSGFISIPLINLRSSYRFRIFRWNESEVDVTRVDKDHNPLPGTEHLLVESEEIEFKPGRGPEQVHLALTGRAGEMRVMFVTSHGEESFVRYGLARTRKGLDQVAGTRVERYEKENMCGAPANQSVGWRDPGYIHDGVMINLENKQRYFYQVGSNHEGWSNIYSFVSPDSNSNETIAFLLGDMGTFTPYTTFQRTQAESKSTIKWISRDLRAIGDRPAIISHVGDISYARGYAWLWDTFFTQIEPIASAAPYHVCVGNHEFNMPGNSSEPTGTAAPATRNLYYSFDMGPVHFVYMSTETNFLPGSNQYQFLEQDLEQVDRGKTPYVVFQGHRPMYTTSSGHKDGALRQKLVEHIEPLLLKNKVSLALWGHVHRYERFCPLNNFTCGSLEKNGKFWEAFPVHIVIGMGGQDWQPTWEPRPEHPTDPVFPQPVRSEFRAGQFGYARIVANMEKLRFSYVGNHDGKVHDSVEIMAPDPSVFDSTSHSLYHDL